MTAPAKVEFSELDLDLLATIEGHVAVFVTPEGKLDAAGRRVNRLTKGALGRLTLSQGFETARTGTVLSIGFPVGMAAEAVHVVKLPRRPDQADARKGGVGLAKTRGTAALAVACGPQGRLAETVLGLVLRGYSFEDHLTGEDTGQGAADIHVYSAKPDEVQAEAAPLLAMADGVFFTRDLTNEPSNVLTTQEFADRIAGMADLGLEIEILEESRLADLGMGALLCVGQGSASPSKVAIMSWRGAPDDRPPLALIGKGVVFDTGGISLKPAVGMEDMTMDMGGAGVVTGVMRALALRKAPANVVGLVGLVENMPSGTAVRPGDVIASMKGDSVEVVNTDAEGRLVLCDVMWFAQARFKPAAMIDLATLTGAIIIGLGHENAGVFSNDDSLCAAFLKAAGTEGEGAWRMPLGAAYDEMLKSPVADMKNIGGRPAGAVTAAQFLQRFVQDGCPWIHLDIAGVAHVKAETAYAPKGSTGWGVLSLNRLIKDRFEVSGAD